jgi:hypothetical protein
MTKLSAAQIAGVVKYGTDDKSGRNIYRLDNPDTDGPIFVAIALAESGGETTAVNDKNRDGSKDYGLWQINSSHSSLLSGGDWRNPTANFQMANSLYRGRGGKFLDWTTFTTGLYAPFLPQATAGWNNSDTSAATHSPVKDATDTVDTAVSNAMDIGAFLTSLTKAATWIRIGMGAAGVLILLLVFAGMMRTKLPGPLGMVARAASKAKVAK